MTTPISENTYKYLHQAASSSLYATICGLWGSKLITYCGIIPGLNCYATGAALGVANGIHGFGSIAFAKTPVPNVISQIFLRIIALTAGAATYMAVTALTFKASIFFVYSGIMLTSFALTAFTNSQLNQFEADRNSVYRAATDVARSQDRSRGIPV